MAVDVDSDISQPRRYRIHPGVASTGRAAVGWQFAPAVDIELANYWLTVLGHALQQEAEGGMGWLVLHAAQAATPYLLRRQDWASLDRAANEVLQRDDSPGTAATLLPALAAAADATRGTDRELEAGRSHARALSRLRPIEAEPLLRQLLHIATARQQFAMASVLSGDLVNHYRAGGRLDAALALIEEKKDYTRRAGSGPWTQLLDEGQRLQILNLQGHDEQVLAAVEELRATMASLPDPPDDTDSTITPWKVRETLLDLGALAARDLERWQLALDLNAEQLASKRGRGAPDADGAWAAFKDHAPLLRLGRVEQARDMLRWCRTVFEADRNVVALGAILSAQADVEDVLGHSDRAIALERDALRLSYLAAAPEYVGASHHNLANYLDRYGEDHQQVGAHLIAAALLAFQTGSGALTARIGNLARLTKQKAS